MAKREVDAAKTAKALRKVRKALAEAEAAGAELTDWERDFAASLEERLEAYGSAFRDPQKGDLDQALSQMQALKVREITKKSKAARRAVMHPDDEPAGREGPQGETHASRSAKRKSGFKKTPKGKPGARSGPRGRDINEDLDAEAQDNAAAAARTRAKPTLVAMDAPADETAASVTPTNAERARPVAARRPALRVVTGGKQDAREGGQGA